MLLIFLIAIDSEHTGKDADKFLHDKIGESLVDRDVFDIVRERHWKERSKEVK